MHGQFHPHSGGGVHKQPTVNLDADLMGTCGCLFTNWRCHWPRRLAAYLLWASRRSVYGQWKHSDLRLQLTAFLFYPSPFPLLHSEQVYNWSPLISGAGASWIKCLEISIARTLPPSGSAFSVWQTVGAEFWFEENMESPVQKLIKIPNKWHSFIKHAYQYAHTHSPAFTQHHSRDLIIATNENREAFLYYYLAFIFP